MSADMHQQVFINEATELLQELEQSLLELEDDPCDQELIARVFRAMHTIKGSGAMFGFEHIASLVHSIETVYDMVRNEAICISREMLDYSLKSCDVIREMLTDTNMKADSPLALEIAAFFGKAANVIKQEPKAAAAGPVLKTKGSMATYRITFKPNKNILLQGSNPTLLINELKEMGKASVVVYTSDVPDLEELEPDFCYISWDVILTTDKSEDDIRDVFIFVMDECDLTVTLADDLSGEDAPEKRIGEILMQRGYLSQQQLNEVLNEKKFLGQLMVEKGIVSPEELDSALVEQAHIKNVRAQKSAAAEAASSIRVPSERLDALVDLVGELVTVQARLSQVAGSRNDADMLKVAEEVERLVWDLRDNTMSIRMLEIGSTFSRFKRLVRDLSQELGKEIELVTFGGETEIDKTVIEKLGDPLVHLIRNSIDHGIELPADRVAAGKPAKGHITLQASHSGDSVLIEIVDDGRGINKQAVLNKAKSKGLIAENAELSDKEIFELIFASGFSTAEAVSSVSGRGVGMDVVRRNIEALRGTIDINSVQGVGTSISLKLPLTLAIIDGLLVSIGNQFFIIPLSIVNECIEFRPADNKSQSGRRIIMVRNELIPYVPLRSFFHMTGEEPEIQQIVIISVDGRRVGFVVDSVVGDHQTVIKSLGKMFKEIDCISGASVLGDGSVALIIDILKIYGDIG
ncbi:chemotaxis protein CheA [Seleniivibrio woodruffii]|uniref:Chemotaxis protein CheA n=1 Tax=Seleniivibrio woodruffii TaxID=1078050 RepID=A0A4R1KCQ8_9BACT|nr:chemotaxis protein CheA [Seleniivibrio woodruffii]TCK61937.1 two-component system chemotaxis sensor kinase CheA [Seleniivibrio woodruffii]TVZ34946.1 CheA signal transduction histidine kinase [Seleniivibrio woodruffii]